MLARVLAILLAFSFWPGASETAEYAVHWVQDGDAMHGARHREPPASPDDDGCPDAGHLCQLTSCPCSGHLAPGAASTVATLVTDEAVLEHPAPHAREGLSDPPPPIRPPIA